LRVVHRTHPDPCLVRGLGGGFAETFHVMHHTDLWNRSRPGRLSLACVRMQTTRE